MCSLAACYDYTYQPDGGSAEMPFGEERDAGAPEAASDLDASTSSLDATADVDAADGGASCRVAGLYCGGNVLSGAFTDLYRCNEDGSGTLVTRCANGCTVAGGTKDDVCKAPSACTVGGFYCGGDKVNGHPDTLYRCDAADGTKVSNPQLCARGCAINVGKDDACR